MKKLLYLLLFGLLFFIPFASRAQLEKINDFNVDIAVNQDSSLIVTETITYDFGMLERHGIYRDIPVKYKREGANYNLRLKVLSVTDEQENPWKYQESAKSGGLRQIKIGDPDTLITGQHVYVIKYEVKRAINYFDDHDELFWNVTGNEWLVTIEKSSATVHLPTNLELSQIQLACYTGKLGSQESDCTKEIVEERTLLYKTDSTLSAYEGLTIVAGWPKNVVQKPSATQNISWIIIDNWFLATPFLAFLILLYLWYKNGREPKGMGTIIPEYEPPDKLPPGAFGVVLDQRADLKDISSTIIDLAVKGYLKIKEIEKKKIIGKSTDYEFIRLKEPDEKLADYEKKIFDSIFKGNEVEKLSDLKNEFYVHLEDIKDKLYDLVVKKGYFPLKPDNVRKIYLGIGAFVCVFCGIAGVIWQSFYAGLSFFVTGLIIIIFSFFMPRRTSLGAETLEKILGLKMFLTVTEKERLKFHNAPEKKPEQFEKFLPYAMVLGVEKEWAKQFEGIYKTPPSWYEGQFTTFSALYLATSLGNLSQATTGVITSRPSSSAGGGSSGFSGGGFSGGGFGGGGGGSW